MTAARTADRQVPLTYHLGAGATGGVWLGLGAARLTVAGLGLLAGISLLTAGAAAPAAVTPLLAALLLVVARIGGRPLLDWAAPAAGHLFSTASAAGTWRAGLPAAPAGGVTRLGLPPECGRPRLVACPDDPSTGLILDRSARTATVVFDIAGVDRFPLLDTDDRDSMVAGWGQALAVLADTDDALVRLQLLERATNGPATTDADSADDASAPLRHVLDTLAVTRDSRLAVQWSFPRLDDIAIATIASRCRTVSRSLLSARLLSRPLSPAEIARDVAAGLRGPQGDTTPVTTPGPVSRRTVWSHVVTDDVVHRCFAVTGWPRTPVSADWLAPLLMSAPAGVTRTVTVHLERVAPPQAARVARTTRAKAALDQRDRVRFGMTTSAALDRVESSGVAMDEELAAGYRTHRVTALVSLSGRSVVAVDGAAGPLRQAAAASRLEIRPLHGQHDRALAATLPLCRLRPRGQA
jgi:hypothetical protein